MSQVTIWRIPKATDTNSEHVILTAFPLKQWLHERASMLRYAYIACLVFFCAKYQHWLWDTPSRSVKLAPHLHLVPRLRMIGVMLPLLHTHSWRVQFF
jgi:hypothetical protein